MAKNIVLTGMPGSGKSSVSMILAKKFENKRILVDTDEKIAEKFGISIPEIFEQFGEKEFRKSEFEIISHLSDKNSLIISVGGGCLCNEQNIEQMRKNGIIFYLKTSVEELLRRTGNDAQRPLLNVQNKKEKIFELENKRKKYYEQSDYIVTTDGKTPEEIANEIKRLYDEYSDR